MRVLVVAIYALADARNAYAKRRADEQVDKAGNSQF